MRDRRLGLVRVVRVGDRPARQPLAERLERAARDADRRAARVDGQHGRQRIVEVGVRGVVPRRILAPRSSPAAASPGARARRGPSRRSVLLPVAAMPLACQSSSRCSSRLRTSTHVGTRAAAFGAMALTTVHFEPWPPVLKPQRPLTTKPPLLRTAVPVGENTPLIRGSPSVEDLVLRLVGKRAGEPRHGAEDRRDPRRRRAAARDLGEHVALRLEVGLVAAEALRRRHAEHVRPRSAHRSLAATSAGSFRWRRPARAASAPGPPRARRALPKRWTSWAKPLTRVSVA